MRKLFLLALFIHSSLVFSTPDFSRFLSVINGSENLPTPVSILLYEEQILHNKALWGANAFSSDISPEYIPEARPKFPLSYFLIPEGQADFLKSSGHDLAINRQITKTVNGQLFYKLFVHPESYEHYRFLEGKFEFIGPAHTEFMASPTSSYRSLVAWNKNGVEKPFIAKVSLDRNVIGSIDRLVSINEVQRSVANQNALELIGRENLRSMGLDYFPESAGMTIKEGIPGAPEKLGGQLIREIPNEVISGEKRWISFSALMSPNKEGKPLVFDIMRASNMNSTYFINRVLNDAYMKMFEEVSLKRGLNFEPHSQNLCFEVDANLKLTGKFVIRDFGGVWPDMITMMKTEGPVEAYQKRGNADRFKFKGGHSNAISSYAFFYKRQVFDMLVKQIQIHDSSYTARAQQSSKRIIDTRMSRMLNTYLIPGQNITPTMANKNQLITYRNKNTLQPMIEGMIEKAPSSDLNRYVAMKQAGNEWVTLQHGRVHKYIITDKGIITVNSARKILGFGIYNAVEARNYPNEVTHLDSFIRDGRSTNFISRCIRGLRDIF